MATKPNFSPTRLQTYLQCPMQYRYNYIEKLGRFYRRPRAAFSLGATLHKTLQVFHESGLEMSQTELTRTLETKWVSAGYTSKAEETASRADASVMAKLYHSVATERKVALTETLWTEKTIKADAGRFNLSGRVDRVDRLADGSLEVIDYKSGRTSITSEDVGESLAMNCYQWILKRLFPEARVISTIYALRSGESASYEMNEDEMDEFGDWMIGLGNEILDRDFEGVEPKRCAHCEYCDFLPRCRSWWANLEE